MAGSCRQQCETHDECSAEFLCFQGYCEPGHLWPGDTITDGDAIIAGDPSRGDTNGDSIGDPSRLGDTAGNCGNGFIEPPEVCDSANLGSKTDCVDFSWTGGGPITCMATCLMWDISACTGPPGNCAGSHATGMQQCVGSDLRGATCESLGFSSGTLECNENCTFDVSSCEL